MPRLRCLLYFDIPLCYLLLKYTALDVFIHLSSATWPFQASDWFTLITVAWSAMDREMWYFVISMCPVGRYVPRVVSYVHAAWAFSVSNVSLIFCFIDFVVCKNNFKNRLIKLRKLTSKITDAHKIRERFTIVSNFYFICWVMAFYTTFYNLTFLYSYD